MSPNGTVLSHGQELYTVIVGGDEHIYYLDLEPDHFIRVVVEQQGADVQLVLQDSTGEVLLRQDSPSGPTGTEEILFVAVQGDRFVLRVESLGDPGQSGGYRLRWVEQLLANEQHLTSARGAQALAAGYLLIEQGDLAAGALKLEEAVSALEESAERRLLAEALRQRGDYRIDQRQLEAAALDLERSGALFRQLGDRGLASVAGVSLGDVLLAQDASAAAISVLSQAATDAKASGLRFAEGEANARSNLGRAYRLQARLGEALNEYQLAEEIYRQLDADTPLAILLYNQGLVMESLGRPEDAELTYLEALVLSRSTQQDSLEVMILAALADSERRLTRFEQSAERLNEAVALIDEREKTLGRHLATVEFYRGQLSLSEREPAFAEQHFLRALELYRERGSRRGEELALFGLGRALWQQGQIDQAQEAHRHAHRLLVSSSNALRLPGSFYALARTYRQQGNLEAAEDHAHWAWHTADVMRQNPMGDLTQGGLLDKRWHYTEFYVDLLMSEEEPAQGADESKTQGSSSLRALQVVEQSRARAFIESMGQDRSDLRRGVPDETFERWVEAQQSFNKSELALLTAVYQDADRGERSRLREARSQSYSELLEAHRAVREASPGEMEIAEPTSLRVSSMPRLLDGATAMLVYFLGEESGWLWVVEPGSGGIHSFEIPGRAELESKVSQFRNLTRSAAPRYQEHAQQLRRELSESLLAPAAEYLANYQRLAIVPDAVLLDLPFAALESPLPVSPGAGIAGSGGEVRAPYLLERFSLVQLPSASSLAALRRRYAERRKAPRSIAMVADVDFGTQSSLAGREQGAVLLRGAQALGVTSFDPLPHTGREADEILAALATESRREALVMRGREGTLQALKSGPLEEFRVLHFATHGVIARERPEFSGLVLAADDSGIPGYLTLHDLYGLNLNADLVVLSACETGQGKLSLSEGLYGLPRGFMVAGAARVVYSLWKVGDESTADLMAAFYHHLGDPTLDYDQALRAAQLDLLRSERWSAPMHWAAFQIGGEWLRELGEAPEELGEDDPDIGKQAAGKVSPDPNPDGDLPIPGPALGKLGGVSDSPPRSFGQGSGEPPDPDSGFRRSASLDSAFRRVPWSDSASDDPGDLNGNPFQGPPILPDPAVNPAREGEGEPANSWSRNGPVMDASDRGIPARERGPQISISKLKDMPSSRRGQEGALSISCLGLPAEGGHGPDELNLESLARLGLGRERDPYLAEIDHNLEERRKNPTRVDPAEGVDAEDLASSGWGIVFAPGVSDEVREALEKLVEWRRREAGLRRSHYFREDLQYRSGWSAADFVRENGGSPYDPAEPEDLPYYLLLVGSPQQIPFRFQAELDHQYAVGRVYFESTEHYRQYAESVVAAEEGHRSYLRRARIGLFGVDNGPGDWPSQRVAALANDLATDLETHRLGRGWTIDRCIGSVAQRHRLLDWLGPQGARPAVVFAGGHGVHYRPGDPDQRKGQGALVMADYQVDVGERRPPVERRSLVGGWDFENRGSAAGVIAFFESCYGLGTPVFDDLEPFLPRPARADEAFCAHLPQQLLGEGGALAVIAHLNRTLVASFERAGGNPVRTIFRDSLLRLLQGQPVGHALSVFAKRLAVTSTRLANLQDDEQRGGSIDYEELGRLLITVRDASNFLVFGDPAVRPAVDRW